MYTCADCTVVACGRGEREKLPKNCPMREEEKMEELFKRYAEPENHAFFVQSAAVEGEGYGEWPRLRETMELCRKMGYQKIGLAFCKGLHREAKIVASLLRREGFEVVSVICKTGGFWKESAGIPREAQIDPQAREVMCNPIAQAEFLNGQNTEFNIELGLCVGHDSLFYKYSRALVTTLVAKDRALANNPCGAIYCAEGYCKERLSLTDTSDRRR